MNTEFFRVSKTETKGFINSFKQHPHLEPLYTHKFNYFGSQWNSVQEAYDSLEEITMNDHRKINLMGQILYACFKQNNDAAAELISTKNMWIEKKVSSHDNFWHNCKCAECFFENGNNYYGRLLMEVRDRLIWENLPSAKNKKRWNIKYFDKQVLY